MVSRGYASEANASDDELWITPKITRAATLVEKPRSNTLPTDLRPIRSATETRRPRRPAPDPTRLQMVAWYAPRLLLLFFVGWSCSIGVQLIHARLDTRGTVAKHAGLSRDLIGRVLEHAMWSDIVSGTMGILVGLAYPYLDHKWQSYLMRTIEWNDVLRCAGGFLGINYAALKLPFESAGQSSLIMAIISLGLWTVCDGTLHGLLLSLSTALMATWLLHMRALSSYDSFTQDDYQGLLAYLPSVLFTYCVMVGSIGRRLGHHPLWKRHRHQHLKRLEKPSAN
ncbi:hypothetical protein GGI25_002267 [Coemansia spiralis]|uniref:Uncharacterized protein n=2 Tax=Coemansia TaxID=4863 RepID=A0A9W8G484_9FUNG|nr:insulin-induced protein-domain-containing protein [Coemansia spiralis]KAJ1995253.1 hypothetical protein EDC05_001091 [Coemansia umbellata]KAJ2625653.1 hypothetical protein GGI26_000453 [Coemansia sp. RSA 1358]KAJ2678473.1 hypothetical protein GGI25_002267 [Coemansia spiralis]